MKVKLICETCGNEFERAKKEATRNKKIGRKSYCSRVCSGKANVNHLRAYDNSHNLKKGSTKDEYTPFRFFVRRARYQLRQRGIAYDITVEYLKELWDKQAGICPYTNIKMNLLNGCNNRRKEGMSPNTASLDRIDSSKGYVKGNVEFVCLFINYAKSNWSKEDAKHFLNQVKKS